MLCGLYGHCMLYGLSGLHRRRGLSGRRIQYTLCLALLCTQGGVRHAAT